MKKLELDYFHGREGEKHSYLIIPKILLTEKEFRSLSDSAKFLYGILLDRNSLSISNGNTFNDNQGHTFIYFSIADVMSHIGCAEQKATKIMSELDDIGLIEKRRLGLGKTNRIYVKDIFSLPQFKNHENHNSRAMNSHVPELRNSQCSNTKSSQPKLRNPKTPSISQYEVSEDESDLDSSSDGLSDEELKDVVEEEIEENKVIPYAYKNDKRKMQFALKYLISYDTLVTAADKSDFEKHTLRMLLECLIEMACADKTHTYKGCSVSYSMVIDRLNECIQHDGWLEAYVGETIDDYIKAESHKEIKNKKNYMKSVIWSSFSTYEVKSDAEIARNNRPLI